MVVGDLVNIPARRQFLVAPESLIPAGTGDPFPGFGCLDTLGNTGPEFLKCFYSRKIHRQPLEPGIGQVHVRVVEARNNKMALEVDNRGRWPLVLRDVFILSYG